MEHPLFSSAPTLVGSFPHREAPPLIDQILRRFREMPAWPQLPGRDFRESAWIQYAEGLPGAVIDAEKQRLFFRRGEGFEGELERFYLAVVEDDVERFAISRDHALGLHLFLEAVGRLGLNRPGWAKGHVTGPFSFAMTVTDEERRSIAYSQDFFEVATQGIAMKARWVARRLRAVAPAALVFIDEPYLCSFGSAFVNVSREDVIAAIETAVTAIHREGALAGLHCCGNTDWSLVLMTNVDVVNFDAFEHFGGLPLYPRELRAFIERGGVLAWGIVPTSDAVLDYDAESLARSLDEHVAELASKGIDQARVWRQSLLTPSCGMGTKTVPASERVVDVLIELSSLLRRRQGVS